VETAILIAAFTTAVLCGFLLLFWIVKAMRGKRSQIGRVAAAIICICWALWQVYVLSPEIGSRLAYFVVPLAAVAILMIISWSVQEITSKSPDPLSEGPYLKIPAMVLRLPEELSREAQAEEEKKVAVGE